jgi:hypothetical protein
MGEDEISLEFGVPNCVPHGSRISHQVLNSHLLCSQVPNVFPNSTTLLSHILCTKYSSCHLYKGGGVLIVVLSIGSATSLMGFYYDRPNQRSPSLQKINLTFWVPRTN